MDSSVKKILIRILLILVLISGIGLSLYYDAWYAAPSRYSIRYETLSSVFIPDQMDNVSILFFSDLDYNRFMNRERLEKLVNEISQLSPDVIIFGGDLFDQDPDPITDATAQEIIDCLSSLHAPLGKFAVFGDFDYRNNETPDYVRHILYESDFELLINQSVLLRNYGSGSVTLTGLDSGLYGAVDISAAFANVSRASYNIVISHTPDLADDVPADLTDYMLSGHSHGGQAYWGFGALYSPPMAEVYFRGKHSIRDIFTLDISNGVGTTVEDVRFLSNAEIVLLRLQHKAMTD